MIRFSNMLKGALLPFFVFWGLSPCIILAEDQASASFRARAIQHVYQWDEEISYFFLDLHQDYEDKPLEIEVFNNSNQNKTFHIDFHWAKSNSNGVLVYEVDDDAILQIVNPVLKLGSFEKGRFKIFLDTTSLHDLEGLIAGAFQIEEIDTKNDLSHGVGHHFIFELGLVLTDDPRNIEKSSQTYALQSLELLENKGLKFSVENQEALLGRNLKIEAILYDKRRRPLAFQVWDSFQFAPQSIWTGEIDLKDFNISCDEYFFTLQINDYLKVEKELKIDEEYCHTKPLERSFFKWIVVLGLLLGAFKWLSSKENGKIKAKGG